jgi:hypothetical protein
MKINRILYIDDSFENGMAAMGVDPRIEFVSSPEMIERPLIDYDYIITDMRMKHAESGFEVVEMALREGRLPYVTTGGIYEHGGTFNRVKVFNSDLVKIFDKVSKSESRFWKEALAFMDINYLNAIQQALRNIKEILGIVPEHQVRMLMDFYKENYNAKYTDSTTERRNEK